MVKKESNNSLHRVYVEFILPFRWTHHEFPLICFGTFSHSYRGNSESEELTTVAIGGD